MKKTVTKVYVIPIPDPPIEGYKDEGFTREVPENSEDLISRNW